MKWIALAAAMSLTVAACGFTPAGDDGIVGIGSTKVITVAGTPQYARAQRVAILQERLSWVLTVLRVGDDPQVTVKVEDGAPSIYAKSVHFVTVTQYDARLHNSTPAALARVWQRHIDKVLRETAPAGWHGMGLTPVLGPGEAANPAETVIFDH